MTSGRPTAESLPEDPMARLLAVMAWLRDRQYGCPWDVDQTFKTIAPYTIEEAYEVADAIERDDMPALKEELGDLLLQVVYHAQIAQEAQAFGFADVAAAIADKMVDRHPHVFADARIDTAEAQTVSWEARKAAERAAKQTAEPTGALDGVARALPALLRAEKIQKRAARVGFDWTETAPVIDKIEEELGELRAEIEAGTVDQARLAGELATCCSRSPIWPDTARSTPRPRSGPPTTSSNAVSATSSAGLPTRAASRPMPASRRWKPSGRKPRRASSLRSGAAAAVPMLRMPPAPRPAPGGTVHR